MKLTYVTNWAYERIYAPPGYKDWKTMSQVDALKRSNKFIRWVVIASKGMTMNKSELEPATDEEIAAWVEERRVAAQADFDELTKGLDELDYERTIADFQQGTRLP